MDVFRPQLVDDAVTLAESRHFTKSCLDEVGALLHVLAGSIPFGKIADIGTGCGRSASFLWMLNPRNWPVSTAWCRRPRSAASWCWMICPPSNFGLLNGKDARIPCGTPC